MDVNRNRGKRRAGFSKYWSTMSGSYGIRPPPTTTWVVINLSSAVRNSAATLCSVWSWGQRDGRPSSAWLGEVPICVGLKPMWKENPS